MSRKSLAFAATEAALIADLAFRQAMQNVASKTGVDPEALAASAAARLQERREEARAHEQHPTPPTLMAPQGPSKREKKDRKRAVRELERSRRMFGFGALLGGGRKR